MGTWPGTRGWPGVRPICCIRAFFKARWLRPFMSSWSLRCCGGWKYLQGGFSLLHRPWNDKKNTKLVGMLFDVMSEGFIVCWIKITSSCNIVLILSTVELFCNRIVSLDLHRTELRMLKSDLSCYVTGFSSRESKSLEWQKSAAIFQSRKSILSQHFFRQKYRLVSIRMWTQTRVKAEKHFHSMRGMCCT